MAVAPVAAIRKQERCVVSGMGGRGEESRAVSISTSENNGAKVQKNATCKVQAVFSGEAGECEGTEHVVLMLRYFEEED